VIDQAVLGHGAGSADQEILQVSGSRICHSGCCLPSSGFSTGAAGFSGPAAAATGGIKPLAVQPQQGAAEHPVRPA
jgi:hypothetical protein